MGTEAKRWPQFRVILQAKARPCLTLPVVTILYMVYRTSLIILIDNTGRLQLYRMGCVAITTDKKLEIG